MFLCYGTGRSSSWAIKVPCLRPTKPREIHSRRIFLVPAGSQESLHESSETTTYRQLKPKEMAYECDVTVFSRLQDVCLDKCGWRRCIPFYGIVDVREITVRQFRFPPPPFWGGGGGGEVALIPGLAIWLYWDSRPQRSFPDSDLFPELGQHQGGYEQDNRFSA